MLCDTWGTGDSRRPRPPEPFREASPVAFEGRLKQAPFMRSINPATGDTIREYSEHDPAEIERRLQQSRDARQIWRRTDFTQRANLLRQAAAVLRTRSAELSRLMTLEMGKLLTAAEAEVEKCAVTCDWCADH